ncbi:MAG: anthrone oxygenase family protein [Pseudomonadota bacterium]
MDSRIVLSRLTALCALALTAAIFGFFYAWVCSTMWGLDRTEPQVAITAMQAMNASVRNAVFFPAFFLTPAALLIAAACALRVAARGAAIGFAAAAAFYMLGAFLPTMAINVPMNEALGALTVPTDRDAAARIWADYSPRWQFWNTVRTLASLAALLATGAALLMLPRWAAGYSAASTPTPMGQETPVPPSPQ